MKSLKLLLFLWGIGYYLSDGQAELSHNRVTRQSEDPPCKCCSPTSSSSSKEIAPGKSIVNASHAAVSYNGTNDEWPWIVALSYNSLTDPDMFVHCGGTLISNRWVVTAAHCLQKNRDLKMVILRLGDFSMYEDKKDNTRPIDIPIIRTISHPLFSANSQQILNIALIRLQNPLELSGPVGNKCASSETCVNIRDCPPLLTLLREQGKNPELAATLRKKQCEPDAEIPKVCCPSSALADPEDFSACGISRKKSFSYFTGVENATIGDWPWMVGLIYRTTTNPAPSFKCGATLISRQWIITVAHCVRGIGNHELLFARIGDVGLNGAVKDGATPVNASIDQIISHPQYSKNPMVNDIALIRLKDPVQYTANIRPICLLNGPQYRSNEYYDRRQSIITGWGALQRNGPMVGRLHVTWVTTVDQMTCAQKYIKQSAALINEQVLCGWGLTGPDSCQGDSGGPLMFINSTDGRVYLGGILSFGLGCNNEYPTVYTKAAQYIEWINQVTGEKF